MVTTSCDSSASKNSKSLFWKYLAFEADDHGLIIDSQNLNANGAIELFKRKEETLPTYRSTSKTDIQIYSKISSRLILKYTVKSEGRISTEPTEFPRLPFACTHSATLQTTTTHLSLTHLIHPPFTQHDTYFKPSTMH